MFDPNAFIKRLEKLMEDQQLSASAFADVLGVQRSGISHVLSGRNKPGLEFILKITDAFPDTDLYWLLKGTPEKQVEKATNDVMPVESPVKTAIPQQILTEAASGNPVSKVMVLYPDGTFSEYTKRP